MDFISYKKRVLGNIVKALNETGLHILTKRHFSIIQQIKTQKKCGYFYLILIKRINKKLYLFWKNNYKIAQKCFK